MSSCKIIIAGEIFLRLGLLGIFSCQRISLIAISILVLIPFSPNVLHVQISCLESECQAVHLKLRSVLFLESTSRTTDRHEF
jgi:hypothetical protein